MTAQISEFRKIDPGYVSIIMYINIGSVKMRNGYTFSDGNYL
jgi:hypothetical protein